jgi:DNA replication and repair protein RecF
MILKSLSIVDLRNIAEAELELSEGVNCFVGRNGAGKTNLLDAVHYLSFCKSALNPVDSQNIREGRPFFVIQGRFEEGGANYDLICSVEKNKRKRFKKDRREYERLADHIGRFPVVLIAPFDLDLVLEGSEKRRRFMDGVISQYDHAYLEDLIDHNKALSQRNALLKRSQRTGEDPGEEAELWEQRMSDTGARIREARERFLDDFVPTFQAIHQRFAGEDEVSLEYRSSGELPLSERLREQRDKDLVLGYTSVGLHKEDLRFRIRGQALKKFGSQGQQKSFVLALKLAQYRFVRDRLGVTPVLLLDDLFDKLDQERMKDLLETVGDEGFGQILISDTDRERLRSALEGYGKEVRYFRVEQGSVHAWNMETTNAL